MKKDDKKYIYTARGNRVELLPNTATFGTFEYDKALETSRYRRSYVTQVFNSSNEFIGWAVPK